MSHNPTPAAPPRFHVPALPPPGDADVTLALPDEAAHHARTVLRLNPGDPLELFDGQGHTAAATLAALDRRAALAHLSRVAFTPPLTPRLSVAVAPPKGPRLDDLVSQLTQLGVDDLILLHTRRTTVDPRPAKLDRLHRIALDAARQCRRPHLPRCSGPLPFAAALQWPGPDRRLLADPAGIPTPPALAAVHHVLVLVGPEGGFTDDERAAAAAAGVSPWRFAPHTLRIETAAPAAAAILRAQALAPTLQ